MTDRDALDMAGLWSQPVVPVDEPEKMAARREPIVRSIARAIVRESEKKKSRRRWRTVGLALSAVAALALGVGIRALAEAPGDGVAARVNRAGSEVEVRALEGTVSVLRAGEPLPVPVESARSLAPGDVVRTEASAVGVVALSESTVVDVASSTRLALQEIERPSSRMRLEQGHIAVRVEGRHDGTERLRVETPDATIVVVGTVFTVDVSPRSPSEPGLTAVAVVRGTVSIHRDGAEVARVEAGQVWSSRTPETETAVSIRGASGDREAASSGRAPARERAVDRGGQRAHAGVPTEVFSGTLAVENAIFQRAIDARNSGDDRSVIAHFDELIRRFPRSPLVSEAKRERSRARQRIVADEDG